MTSGACLLIGCAGDQAPEGTPIGGTVTGVYEEPVPGILLDRALRPSRDPAATIWVAVRPRPALGQGRERILARTDDPEVLRGDYVLVQAGDGPGIALPGPLDHAAAALSFVRVAEATRAAAPRLALARRGIRVEVEVEGP